MSGSFLREGRIVRSDEISSEERERKIAESLQRLDAMTDADVDLSDIPETTPEQWEQRRPNPYFRPVKDQVTLRIDRDVLSWFRHNHEKYQTAINQALRDYMNSEHSRKASG